MLCATSAICDTASPSSLESLDSDVARPSFRVLPLGQDRGFQPYLGGDDLLWALNEICITDKHKLAVPIGHTLMKGPMSLKGTGFFSMPEGPVWDRAKNEMILIRFGPDAKYNYDFKFQLFVAFNEIQVVDGKPVFAVLNTLCSKVESILMAIEAESRRLGIIK